MVSQNQFWREVFKIFSKKNYCIANRIAQAKKPPKLKGIKKIINNAKVSLELTGQAKKFESIKTTSIVLSLSGVCFSILLNNIFLLPVLGIGLALIPFWYAIFSSYRFQKQINDELEISLSTITTSYLRNEDIITAVKENLEYIYPPVLEIFQEFLNETELLSTNLVYALNNMKDKVNNDVFHEWIDALVECQNNRNLKTTLAPIVSKLSEIRSVSMKLENLLYEPLKEFFTMAMLLFANVPLLFFLNRDWFNILVGTMIGKLVLAFSVGATIISFAAVMRLTKPLKYKR